ncbi:MAG: type II toxin-antitoxin system PemK/MazF family toxin [Bifidobacteriaceae bacterium]|jgi:mRNA interferase MazF|nr:type II toxin-antitoxin system PemK/MazF family toxin [Bifidobacteriaceae bacterium]
MPKSWIEVRRGQIWLVAMGAARPGKLGKNRPAIIMTPEWAVPARQTDPIMIVPLSASAARSQLRPTVTAESLNRDSVAFCDLAGGVASSRLVKPLGEVDEPTLIAITRIVTALLGGMECDQNHRSFWGPTTKAGPEAG